MKIRLVFEFKGHFRWLKRFLFFFKFNTSWSFQGAKFHEHPMINCQGWWPTVFFLNYFHIFLFAPAVAVDEFHTFKPFVIQKIIVHNYRLCQHVWRVFSIKAIDAEQPSLNQAGGVSSAPRCCFAPQNSSALVSRRTRFSGQTTHTDIGMN